MGISAAIAGIIDAIGSATAASSAFIAGDLTALGVGAPTAELLGDAGTGALIGGGLGAATDPKHPLQGAEEGAISGAAIGLGPALGAATGLGTTAGDALAGAAGGALGGAATGQNIGQAALGGAASGLGASALSSLVAGATSPSSPTPGGAGSAAASAAPAGVTAPGADATLQTGQSGVPTPSGSSTGLGSLNTPSTSLASAPLPGAINNGAASGVPSQTGGVNAPASQTGGLPAGGADAPGTFGDVQFSTAPKTAADGALLGQAGVPTAPGSSTGLGSLGPAPGTGPLSSIGGFIKDNPWAVSAAGLGLDALRGNQMPKGYKQLEAQAASDVQQGNQLQSYLRGGSLPTGLQAGVNSATQSAEASIRQQYANLGLSGSTSEAQDLARVQSNAQAETADIATKLFQQGVSETQLGTQIYDQLMQVTMQQDQQFSAGVSNFVSAMAGLGQPTRATQPTVSA